MHDQDLFSDEEVLAGVEGAGVGAAFAPSFFVPESESLEPVEAEAEGDDAEGVLLLLL